MERIRILTPDKALKSLSDVDLSELHDLGKKALLVDLDNTMAYWNESAVPRQTCEFIEKAKNMGFKIIVISNNTYKRAESIINAFELEFLANAGKPGVKAFHNAAAKIGALKNECVVIGDQLFTDIMGAKRAGFYAILLRPLGKREFIGTKIARVAERLVLKIMRTYP